MARSVLLKNLLVMTVAAPLSSLIGFATTVIIARILKADGFGYYSQIVSIISIFQIVVEASRTYLIRDIAQRPEDLASIFGEAKAMLWCLAVVCFFILLIILNLPGQGHVSMPTTIMAGLGAVALFHALGYGIVFVATEKMELNAIGSVAHKIVAFILIYLVTLLPNSLFNIFTAFAIAHCGLFYYYAVIFKKMHGDVSLVIKYKSMKTMLKEVVFLGGTAIVRRLSWNMDVLLLSWLGSASAAGIFNGAYNIIFSINMIPWIATLAFFPRLSKLAVQDRDRLRRLCLRVVLSCFIVLVPVVAGSYPFSDKIIILLLGEQYRASIEVMRILWIDLLFSFPISFLFYFFVSLGFQRYYLISTSIGLAINFVIDILLIKRKGEIGAAIGTLTADICTFVLLSFLLFFAVYRRNLIRPAEDVKAH